MKAIINLFKSREVPPKVGVLEGKLKPCPQSPNCVSTQASDPQHRIPPINYTISAEQAFSKIKRIISSLPRTQIITEKEFYLHVTFTTRLFRFVDDVEFLVDPQKKVIELRSASRVGHSDLGANRRRMEMISKLFEKG